MYDKENRHNVIKELLKTSKIQSQEDLQELLSQRGFAVTQATLSRDMKALRIVKMHDPELGYAYHIPAFGSKNSAGKSVNPSIDGIVSLEFSDSFAVIKTKPGFASVVASIVDNSVGKMLMGTIAGDDTVLLMLRSKYTHQEILSEISSLFLDIESKIIEQ